MPRESFRNTILGTIILGVVSSWMANQLGFINIREWFTSAPRSMPTPTPTPTPTPARKDVRMDPRKEQLLEQYDAFNSRFSAIEASLHQRASDLGNLPVKPEVTASIQTTRSDLAEANSALSQGNLDRAAIRLKRVEEALKYLESL